jgi:hypothetical protein
MIINATKCSSLTLSMGVESYFKNGWRGCSCYRIGTTYALKASTEESPALQKPPREPLMNDLSCSYLLASLLGSQRKCKHSGAGRTRRRGKSL